MSDFFSSTYQQARSKFQKASSVLNLDVDSYVLPHHVGIEEETLATDVVLIGEKNAEKLLIITSATHGPEGLCGSGCEIALLNDTDLLARFKQANVACLVVHAVNPYGFSYLQRQNEENIDPNRNCLDFSLQLPANDRYAEVEALLLPTTWPPTEQDDEAVRDFIQTHGHRVFREAMSKGQSASPAGLFYAGVKPSWSNLTTRAILKKYASDTRHVAWLDIHTGLGPPGHAEKIYAGRQDQTDLRRARAWWGSDVFSMFDESVSMEVRGTLVSTVYEECPQAQATLMGLEFGSLPEEQVLLAMRADVWHRRNPGTTANEMMDVRRQVRDAFYCDNDEWRGKVLGQFRTIVLQTTLGLRDQV